MAKNIWSKVSVQEHVAFGSHGVASRYISCCKSEAAVQRLAFLSRTNPKRIALLKVGLVYSNMKIIDLTYPRELLYHLEDPRAIRLATQFEEVLVEDYIHKTCFVRYIPYKPIVAGIY